MAANKQRQKRESIYAILTGFAALIGLASAWMPTPFDGIGNYMILIGLLLVVVAGHRAAFRIDNAGIFAFWWKPVKTATARIEDDDQWPLFFAMVVALSPVLSILSRIVWMDCCAQ